MKKVKDISASFKKIQSGLAYNVNPPTSYGLDIITIKHLTKQFMGIKAIDDLTVNIPQAMTIGLIGSNGSGKTTLVNILTGMLFPDSGEITVRDKKRKYIKSHELRKYRIARTFQDGRLIEQMSVVDNLLLPVAENNLVESLKEISTKDYQDRLEKVLEITSLTEHRRKNAEELSYGLRKLLEIGRVLMQDADIYFFDEPFSGLFPEIVEQVCEIICGLQRQGKTIVIIEHNMSLIRRLCDYIIVLNHGKLLAEGKPEEVLQNKAVQESYLGV
jgi:branched-chain amino acid transport system ATP-binding protein